MVEAAARLGDKHLDAALAHIAQVHIVAGIPYSMPFRTDYELPHPA